MSAGHKGRAAPAERRPAARQTLQVPPVLLAAIVRAAEAMAAPHQMAVPVERHLLLTAFLVVQVAHLEAVVAAVAE